MCRIDAKQKVIDGEVVEQCSDSFPQLEKVLLDSRVKGLIAAANRSAIQRYEVP
jgi:hypothetical protein